MPVRPLYLMACLPPILQALFASFPRTDRSRSASLLHLRLLSFVDLAAMPAGFVPDLIELLSGLKADPFRVVFNNVVAGDVVALRGSEAMRGAASFQRRLTRFLAGNGFPYFGTPPVPHVTLNYRNDALGNERIDPISWQVTEVALIESVVGETRHIEHGRFRLGIA